MTVECDNTEAGSTQGIAQYKVEPDESPSMAVVEAVAAASEQNPTGEDGLVRALDPLGRSIDPEALDRIVESCGHGQEDPAVIEFQYSGHQVTVKAGDQTCVTVQ